ncbi:hypothetical protein LMG23994_00310 [Cupriavidus pinatubonensis]|uniref:Antirepressor protein C-terminal domain-containing protein n=2 Tax=Cupriavidus pinatubonensis TaxID=248026 RepID=A0ABN7XSH3_9BURK|nr:hypothetical protein LMG23994_00310 [Cupriavidus pinatubonensis]
MDLETFTRISLIARKKRRREENKRQHAQAATRRTPGWDDTLPPVLFSISEVAKRTGLRRGELFARLEAAGWIRWDLGTQAWAACDVVVEPGLMAVRRKRIGWSAHVHQAMVTPAGWAELVRAGIAVAGES